MQHLRLLLLPFSWIYATATMIRNKLFDFQIIKQVSYPIPIISVGNITVGGTGKTPLTEYLVRLFIPHKQIAILSRGYGRKTKGVIIAEKGDNSNTIGDEPMQMKEKYHNVFVAVAEKRKEGMRTLLNLPAPPEVVLLDDAYQHRHVKPGLSILVTDYYRPLWKDFCLPAGNLREPAKGKSRADIIIINKCPETLSRYEASAITKKIKPKPNQKLYFTSIDYDTPCPLSTIKNKTAHPDFKEALTDKGIIAIAGIGNPQPFFNKCRTYSDNIKTLSFGDHHNFSKADLEKIAKPGCSPSTHPSIILTTEKDAIRLYDNPLLSHELANRIWYIPIKINFLFEKEVEFEKDINTFMEQFNSSLKKG